MFSPRQASVSTKDSKLEVMRKIRGMETMARISSKEAILQRRFQQQLRAARLPMYIGNSVLRRAMERDCQAAMLERGEEQFKAVNDKLKRREKNMMTLEDDAAFFRRQRESGASGPS